jgi:WD40 repeat protein
VTVDEKSPGMPAVAIDARGHADCLKIRWSHPGTYVSCLTFSPRGDTLAAGGGNWPEDGSAEIWAWRTDTDKHIATIAVPSASGVGDLAFAPSGAQLPMLPRRRPRKSH